MSEYTPYKKVEKLPCFYSLDNIYYPGTCSCIYVIRNSVNDKAYIGKTVDYKDRYHSHKLQFKRNKHYNKHLLHSFMRGDKLEMYILENCLIEDLDSREIFWIEFFKSYERDNGYNLTKGGEGGAAIEITQENRNNRSKAHKGRRVDNSHNNIPIIVYSALTQEFIKECKSLKEAAIYTGVSQNDVSSICRGRNYRAKSYIFRYKQNDHFPLYIKDAIPSKIINKININTSEVEESILTLASLERRIGYSSGYLSKVFKKKGVLIHQGYKYQLQ